MIFDRGGLACKEPAVSLKVSLELFRVRDFNRVDRVERVEVGEPRNIRNTRKLGWKSDV